MPAGFGAWDNRINENVEGDHLLASKEGRGREEGEAMTGGLLQSWGQNKGIGFRGEERGVKTHKDRLSVSLA